MKELKTYISEGFFNNVGANNIVKPVIDVIKDANMNNKINTHIERQKFADLLTPILKDLEANIKKGKLAFEYVRNDGIAYIKTIISLEIDGLNDVRWSYTYGSKSIDYKNHANAIAFIIANDIYFETTFLANDPKLRHSIANTIKVTEFKVS